MPATIIDSTIFGDIFSTDGDAPRLVGREPDAEVPRHRGGARPRAGAARASSRRRRPTRSCATARSTRSTWRSCRPQTERIGYPVLGVVSQLNALCRDRLGEYCHWGATTQDITDTATVLQIREALDLVEADLTAISASLADARAQASRHADDRPQQPAAGDPGHVRLQDGRAALRDRTASGAPRAAARRACWSASSPARPARWRRSRRARWRRRRG